jgi:DNA-binding transcriptional MerR regulator
MSPVRLFHKYRGLRNLTLASLLAAVVELLPKLVGRQVRYRVTELPTERTLRYYITQGLVDSPSGKKGTSSLYGYRHLLQVLAIKYLQSQYLPLKKIRALLKGRSNRELELLLPDSKTHRASLDTVLKDGGTAGESEPPVRRPSPGGERWRRVKVRAGLEIHFREDIAAPRDPEELRKWQEDLLRPLERLWLEAGGRGTGE